MNVLAKIMPTLNNTKKASLMSFASQTWSKISYTTKKKVSFDLVDTPSQLPIPGDPEWDLIIDNFKKNKHQSLPSSYEIKHDQEMHEMKTKLRKCVKKCLIKQHNHKRT